MDGFAGRVDGHAVHGLSQSLDAAAAPDLCTQRLGADRKDGLDARHFDRHAPDRAGQAVWPLRCIDLIVKELDAGEMTGGATLLLHPVRTRWRLPARRASFQTLQQAAAVEALDRRHRETTQAKRLALERRVRVSRLFQDQHRTAGDPQFTSQKKADGTSARDDDVVGGSVGDLHKLLRCRCSTGAFPRPEDLTDERLTA